MSRAFRYSVLLALVSGILLLAGCVTQPKPPAKKIQSPCLDGVWLYKNLHFAAIDRVGDTYTIVLPSDRLFIPYTANIKPEAYRILDASACLIRRYEKVTVGVSGFTNYFEDRERDFALSRQQAANVANYLWRRGIEARLVYGKGFGQKYPIANTETQSGQSFNRRIIIKFRRLEF